MTALDFFEEIRFVLELLVAEHLFAAAVGLKKEAYGQRLLGGGAALLAAACVYPFLAGQFTYIDSHFLLGLVNVVWYVLLAVGSAFLIRLCYEISLSDTLFLCVTGYCVQHMEFVLVNEVLAKGIWKGLTGMLPVYVLVCVVTTAALYALIYRIFRGHLAKQKGQMFDDRPENLAFTSLMYLLVFLVHHLVLPEYLALLLDLLVHQGFPLVYQLLK